MIIHFYINIFSNREDSRTRLINYSLSQNKAFMKLSINYKFAFVSREFNKIKNL